MDSENLYDEVQSSDAIKNFMTKFGLEMIVSKIPSAIDGLLPVHRRLLNVIQSKGEGVHKLTEIIGRMSSYHVAGESSIGQASVYLSQEFNNIAPLLEIEGNQGAYYENDVQFRYVELAMSEFAKDVIFRGTNKAVLEMVPSDDGTTLEPKYYVPKLPLAFLTGALGIASGFKSHLMPLGFKETCDLAINYIQHVIEGNISSRSLTNSLSKFMVPDFPIAMHVKNKDFIVSEYLKNKYSASIAMDGELEITPNKIIIKTLPYGKNPENVLTNLREQHADKNSFIHKNFQLIQGLQQDILECTIECTLRRGVEPFDVLDKFKKICGVSARWACVPIYLDQDRKCKYLSPAMVLREWYTQRYRVVHATLKRKYKSNVTEVRKINALISIVDHTKFVTETIRLSTDPDKEAVPVFMEKFNLTAFQARYIVDLPLRFTSGLGRDQLVADREKILAENKKINEQLQRIDHIILEDVKELKKKYSPKFARKAKVDRFMGHVQIGIDGYIQFDSIDELVHLTTMFKDINDIVVYPKGVHYKYFNDSEGFVKDESDMLLSKYFKTDKISVTKTKPTNSIILTDDKRIYRNTGVVSTLGRDVTYVGDSFVNISSGMNISRITSTDVTLRKGQATTGTKFDSIHFENTDKNDLVIVSYNVKNPNLISFHRNKVGDKIKKQSLMGETKILKVFNYGEDIVLNVPEKCLSRCNTSILVLNHKDEFLQNLGVCETVDLSKKKTSEGKKVVFFKRQSRLYTIH